MTGSAMCPAVCTLGAALSPAAGGKPGPCGGRTAEEPRVGLGAGGLGRGARCHSWAGTCQPCFSGGTIPTEHAHPHHHQTTVTPGVGPA